MSKREILIPFSLQKGGKKAKFCLEFVQINKEYRIGLRAVKTAIAVFVCAVISTIITHEEDIFCSCIAAVICMQPTCEQTLQAGTNRFIGTVIGAIVGYISLELCYMTPYYYWLRIFALPFGILAVIYICNFINHKTSVRIGCIVVIVLLARSGVRVGNTLYYVIQRASDTLVGVAVAMVVNKVLSCKKIKKD